MGSVVLTSVYRGSYVESVHRGSIAVVDSLGRLLAFAGDPALHTCLRSSAKPFQAIPLLEYGGIDEFDLTGEEIALTCASHGGEPVHVATAAALLRKGELDEEDLLCGAHFPFDDKAAADLRASGEFPSPLHNNCSGKHAGMLLATQVMDVPGADYTAIDHPLQGMIREILGEFAGVEKDEIAHAIDGCGVPAFFLPLYRSAYAYARLMASAEGAAAPGMLARYLESSAHIVEAMTAFPHYVAGNWSMTTPLMAAFGGGLLAKEGGEGFYAMALAPALRGELASSLPAADDAAIGIAIKIDDGSMDRGRNPVILRLLDLLGLDVGTDLQGWRRPLLHNHAGDLIGEVRAEFDLEVL
jgi:L-asparaginase II